MCRCKFRTRRLGRARARSRPEDKFLDLASPTQDAIVESCGWSVVKVANEHPVIEGSPASLKLCLIARQVKQGLMEYLSKGLREKLQLDRLVVPILTVLKLGI